MRSLVNVPVSVSPVCTITSKFVSVDDLLNENSSNYLPDIKKYLDDCINLYFESYLNEEDVVEMPSWKLHSIFKKVSKELHKDLNEQVHTKKLMSSDFAISVGEARAIITLFYGSDHYKVPQEESVFYNNKYVVFCLESHQRYLRSIQE